jgi:hypothetical protein
VSIGCVSTAYFFLRFFEQPISGTFLWLLGSSTWLIFTLDHWMDALKVSIDNLPSRHQKHLLHSRILIILMSLLSGFNLMLVWLHQTEPYILPGLIALVFMAGYFLLVHKGKSSFTSKELSVAIGATLGMCVMPAFVEPIALNLAQVSLWAIFFLIHLINIYTFSRFSMQEDFRTGTTSMATVKGFSKISRSIFNLIVLTYLVMLIWIFLFNHLFEMQISLIILLMINGLALINFKYYTFKKHNYYRFWGDALYWIPGLLIWILG